MKEELENKLITHVAMERMKDGGYILHVHYFPIEVDVVTGFMKVMGPLEKTSKIIEESISSIFGGLGS